MTIRKKTDKPKHSSGPSGKNQLHDVKLRAEEDEIEDWNRAAQASSMDRNSFLRLAANERAARILRKD